MKKLDYLKSVHKALKNPNLESIKMSMDNVHHDNLFSLVIKGTEPGKLTRAFIANSEIEPYDVQLHSHRYPIKLTVIKGKVMHHLAFRSEIQDFHTTSLSEFKYKSPLNGGSGLSYLKEGNFILKDINLPIGSSIEMDENEIHSVSCSKGSIWIVEEKGFKTDESVVLGVPFTTEGYYTEPRQFQINDNVQLVAKEIKKIILDYELV